MEQQAISQSFQDFKQSTSSKSSNSSASPSPSATPLSISNHAVTSLLNLQQTPNYTDNSASSYSFNQSVLQAGNNTNPATIGYSPALMAAIANMSSSYNNQQAVAPNFPYYDFSNNFQQFMNNFQQIDNPKKQEILNENADNHSVEFIKKETSQSETLSSLSLYSSLGNTPVSLNSSLNKKRALSDVISKLRNNQQSDIKDDGSYALEELDVNNNLNENEPLDSSNHNESDLINDEEEGSQYSPSKLFLSFFSTYNL